jgi:hypothetical protein
MGGHDAAGDLVLHGEDVAELAVVALGRDVLGASASASWAVTRMRPAAVRTLPSST